MTRTTVTLDTVYSSAQCVLSVVGSVGVILLFAGIPQLIYSPVASVGNLMTFLVGALLITTMVAGNSFLNYKYRRFERRAMERRRAASQERGGRGADPEDKPPSYDAIISSDGLPPDYFTILPEKPPRYEEIAHENSAINPSLASSSLATITTTACSSDTLTITSETSLAVYTVDVSSSSSSMSHNRDVDDLPEVFQTVTNIKGGEETREGGGTDSAQEKETNTSENKKESIGVVSQETRERVSEDDDDEVCHTSESEAKDEHSSSQERRVVREQDADETRRRIDDTCSKMKLDQSRCVHVTSLQVVAQNSTHLEESET